MKKVIISAQWFWWGPISKSISLINELKKNKNIYIIYIWNSKLKNFLEKNKNNINEIIYIDNYFDIEKYILKIKPSFTISIMEPYLVYYSYLNKINTYLIDSLNFFWNWDEYKELEIDKINIDKISPHLKQYLWYYLANKIYIQDIGNEINNNLFNEKIIKSWYILEKNDFKSTKTKKIILSFCWLLSPIIDLTRATLYINFCLNILTPSLIELSEKWYEIHIVWNIDLISKIKLDIKSIYINFYSKIDYLKLLNESELIFWPASLTSVLESLWANTQYVVLPEQHDWHFINFNTLNNKDCVFKWVMLTNYFENLFNIKENNIDILYKIISKVLSDNKFLESISLLYLEVVKNFLDTNDDSQKILLKQKEVLDFEKKKNWTYFIIKNIISYED